jgi:hypothetical protein
MFPLPKRFCSCFFSLLPMISNWSSPPTGTRWIDPDHGRATWIGGVNSEGLPHGNGTLNWPCGRIQGGAMEDGRRQGPWIERNMWGRWLSFPCTDGRPDYNDTRVCFSPPRPMLLKLFDCMFCCKLSVNVLFPIFGGEFPRASGENPWLSACRWARPPCSDGALAFDPHRRKLPTSRPRR